MKNKNIVQSLTKGWKFKAENSDEWLDATVPGSVHLDLFDNNIIPDPFIGTNEIDLQWISDSDWCYKLIFMVDADLLEREKIKLKFYGLDTYAEVFLNKKQILSSDNMFRPWEVDIKSQLIENTNELIIKFLSPISTAMPLMEEKTIYCQQIMIK